jgi:3-oxoadipate enol-lactonase
MKADLNDIRVFYRDEGAGLPVLFVHGFPLDGELWQPQLEDLASDYRMLVPDLRGFGQSTPTQRAAMEQYAEDLVALLDERGIDSAVIVGLSMGGYVALAFQRMYPERLQGIALVDTRAQPDTADARAGRMTTALRVKEHGTAVLADDMLEKLLSPSTYEAQPHLVETVRQMIARQRVEGVVAALHGMADRPDSRPMLGDISVPTLIVVGADDTITPRSDAHAMADAIPGAELHVVPRAAHLSNLEQPADFNGALREFLETRLRS